MKCESYDSEPWANMGVIHIEDNRKEIKTSEIKGLLCLFLSTKVCFINLFYGGETL